MGLATRTPASPRYHRCALVIGLAAAVAGACAHQARSGDPAATAEPGCGETDRGELQPDHWYLGLSLAAVARRRGDVICRRRGVAEVDLGPRCADISTFREVLTLELHRGIVQRVWSRSEHNDGFCS